MIRTSCVLWLGRARFMSFTTHCLMFEYLCFAVVLVTQHPPSSPCTCHTARAGAAGAGAAVLQAAGLPFPRALLRRARHFASPCADGSAGETGDSGDGGCGTCGYAQSSCPPVWRSSSCVRAVIARNPPDPGELNSQGCSWTSLPPRWACTRVPGHC